MVDYLFSIADPSNVWILILLTGVVTYITRSGGHVVLARFSRLHPRVEAALEAVPGAVLITLILPPVLTSGPVEIFAMLAAFVASLRVSALPVLLIGLAIVVVGRQMGL